MADLLPVGVGFKDPLPDTPPDVLEGLLPEQGQLLITGETNVGKSLLAIEVCSSLSTGTPLWGQIQPSKTLPNIKYILAEHFAGVIQRLFRKTGLQMHDNVRLIAPEHLGVGKQLVINGLPQKQTIDKLSKWCEGADFVVFDPLAAFVAGAAETENASVPMRTCLDMMGLIAGRSGAASLILHHLGKPYVDKEGGEHHRKAYASRGSSGIEDAATNIFYLLRAEGSSSMFHLNKRKYKGDAPERHTLQRDPDTLTHTLCTGPRPTVDGKRQAFKRKLLVLQMDHPEVPFTKLVEILASAEGVGRSTAFTYIKE